MKRLSIVEKQIEGALEGVSSATDSWAVGDFFETPEFYGLVWHYALYPEKTLGFVIDRDRKGFIDWAGGPRTENMKKLPKAKRIDPRKIPSNLYNALIAKGAATLS
jgi:hypothetical protein